MPAAKNGDTVLVHYTGSLEDGAVFDSSRNGEPLEFTLGSGTVVPGFENAVVGMNEGETKKETIDCQDAYGERQDELTAAVPRQQFPEDLELEVGRRLQVQSPDGRTTGVTIVGVSEEAVTLDANHPLAGRDLTFEIELVEIKAA